MANSTDLAHGRLGEATLQARYIRGATGGKPYTLGKYEHVRVRTAIAELAANGGCPMGFYTRFEDPMARGEIVRYYQFLHANAHLYHRNHVLAEAVLLFPRRRVHVGDLEALSRFQQLGRSLLDQHVLFEVIPDEMFRESDAERYRLVVDPSNETAGSLRLPAGLSVFHVPETVRVSASRAADTDELAFHFVNYNREERADKSMGSGIQDERPIATPQFSADVNLPAGKIAKRVELLTPELEAPQVLAFRQENRRMSVDVPGYLVYGVLRIQLESDPK
jgi:hypothetical protein